MKPSNPLAFDVTVLPAKTGKKAARPRSTYKARFQAEFGQREDRKTAERSWDRFYQDEGSKGKK